jgi:hypothetical protein
VTTPTTAMNDDRRPLLTAYLEQLPAGLASFPSCEASSVMLRGLVQRHALAGLDSLPREALAALSMIDRTEWLPEVVHVAAMLALRDARFHDDEAFLAWTGKLNREVMLDHATSSAEALRLVPQIWSRLHRGTTVELFDLAEHSGTLLTRHPHALFAPLIKEWRSRAVLAFLARAGAVQPRAMESPTQRARSSGSPGPEHGGAMHLPSRVRAPQRFPRGSWASRAPARRVVGGQAPLRPYSRCPCRSRSDERAGLGAPDALLAPLCGGRGGGCMRDRENAPELVRGVAVRMLRGSADGVSEDLERSRRGGFFGAALVERICDLRTR